MCLTNRVQDIYSYSPDAYDRTAIIGVGFLTFIGFEAVINKTLKCEPLYYWSPHY